MKTIVRCFIVNKNRTLISGYANTTRKKPKGNKAPK